MRFLLHKRKRVKRYHETSRLSRGVFFIGGRWFVESFSDSLKVGIRCCNQISQRICGYTGVTDFLTAFRKTAVDDKVMTGNIT